jgi:hypothetical protein
MCRIWRISLPFGCILAYQVWYVCFQGKARLFQHTDSQLETFWTLQVRVVVLDDGLYLATWYTMDGLNRKRYIRNPIWIEFNKTVLSAPQSVLNTNFKILRALRLLFLSILIWGRKVSLLSKRRPKNLVSETILIWELYNFNSGFGWSPLLLQKCIPRVFELENLNPFSIAHFSILFRHSCNCLSMLFIFLPR